jgi:hypothetical protein
MHFVAVVKQIKKINKRNDQILIPAEVINQPFLVEIYASQERLSTISQNFVYAY